MKGDPYTFGRAKSAVAVARERVTGEAESVLLRRRASDRELRRLELADKHRRGEIDRSEKEPWERAKEALERSGSFGALREALAGLRRSSEFDYAAVRVVYGGDAELREVGAALQARADAAVVWLAARMPARIEVPTQAVVAASGTGRWANPCAQRDRDREIWRLHTVEGLNREQIGRRLGVDRSTVSRVLAAKAA